MHCKRTTMIVMLALTISLHAQTKSQSLQASQSVISLDSNADKKPPITSANAPMKEDWATISLAQSGLRIDAVAGTVLSKVELAGGCTRELLHVQWRPVDPIDLYVIRPAGIDRPPVAIFLLNYTFDTDVFRSDGWCNQARKDGLAIIGFGSALSKQRFHSPRPMKEWFVSELQEALSTSTHDVQMVLNYLETRKDLDMKRVGIFGQGSGGAIAILAAAADERITALDLTDPWGDWPDWLKESKQIPEEERTTYLNPEFLQKVETLDPTNYLSRLNGRKLRIQQVMSDLVTPAAAKNKIANAVPHDDEVVRYTDNAAEYEAWGSGGISAWLAKQLSTERAMASEF